MASIKLLIVEDELMVAKDISMRLSELGFSITAICGTVDEALLALKEHEIDLVLIDIQLRGTIDGIELAHQINTQWHKPIIFLTSFSDSLTVGRARDSRPAAYILKPFNDKELGIAIELAISNYAKGSFAESIISAPIEKNTEEAYSLSDSLFLRKKDRFERVKYDEILWAEAQSNYTSVVSQREKFMMAITLQEIEKQLLAPYFIRTHRSFVVNLKKVDSLQGNMLYIDGQSIPVSKSKRDLVFTRFRKI